MKVHDYGSFLESGELYFEVIKYLIPGYECLKVFCDENTQFFQESKPASQSAVSLARERVSELLLPYGQSVGAAEPSEPHARFINAIMGEPLMEGLWIKATGRLEADGDDLVDVRWEEGSDQPIITGIASWIFSLYAEEIILFAKPEIPWKTDKPSAP